MPPTPKSPGGQEAVPWPPAKKVRPETEDQPKLQDDEAPKLQVVKLSRNAVTPTRGSGRAAGYDLYSARGTEIPARGKALVETDLQVRVPKGTYGRVAPRSGLAWNNHIDIGAGVVDEDYRGALRVVMFNHAEIPFTVEKGDRVAQLVCQKVCYPEIELRENLDETERGNAGFGSTGKK